MLHLKFKFKLLFLIANYFKNFQFRDKQIIIQTIIKLMK